MFRTRRLPAFLAVFGLTAPLLVSCDGSSGPQSPEELLLERLGEAATPAETSAVALDWADRPSLAVSPRVEADTFWSGSLIPRADTSRLVVLSHLVDGFRHQGAILLPRRGGPWPVLAFAHGGDEGIGPLQTDILLSGLGSLADSLVVLLPSFRAEPCSLGGAFLSEGQASPWDRDVDDLLGFVRAAASSLPGALDTTRLFAAGYSRGGGVALLAAERDPLFLAAASISGPTDLRGSWALGLARRILDGEAVARPGLDVLEQEVLRPALDGRLSVDSARLALIRRSPLPFAHRLLSVWLFWNDDDTTVAPTEGRLLAARLSALERSVATRDTSGGAVLKLPPLVLPVADPHLASAVQGFPALALWLRGLLGSP